MAEVEIDMAELARLVISQLQEQFSWAILLIQAIGVIVIIYILFRLIGILLEYNKRRRIKRIEQKVTEIDEKLDRVIKKLNHKETKRKTQKK